MYLAAHYRCAWRGAGENEVVDPRATKLPRNGDPAASRAPYDDACRAGRAADLGVDCHEYSGDGQDQRAHSGVAGGSADRSLDANQPVVTSQRHRQWIGATRILGRFAYEREDVAGHTP
jgi:hypothetical protein